MDNHIRAREFPARAFAIVLRWSSFMREISNAAENRTVRSSEAKAAAIAGPVATNVALDVAEARASKANRCTKGSRSVISFRTISASGASGRVRPTAHAVRARTKFDLASVSFDAVPISSPPNISTRISIARSLSAMRRVSVSAASRKTSGPSDFACGTHVARDQLLLGWGASRTAFNCCELTSGPGATGGVPRTSLTMRNTLPRVPRPPTLTNRLPSGATSMSVGANPN